MSVSVSVCVLTADALHVSLFIIILDSRLLHIQFVIRNARILFNFSFSFENFFFFVSFFHDSSAFRIRLTYFRIGLARPIDFAIDVFAPYPLCRLTDASRI